MQLGRFTLWDCRALTLSQMISFAMGTYLHLQLWRNALLCHFIAFRLGIDLHMQLVGLALHYRIARALL